MMDIQLIIMSLCGSGRSVHQSDLCVCVNVLQFNLIGS